MRRLRDLLLDLLLIAAIGVGIGLAFRVADWLRACLEKR
jgi:hypothetical protein